MRMKYLIITFIGLALATGLFFFILTHTPRRQGHNAADAVKTEEQAVTARPEAEDAPAETETEAGEDQSESTADADEDEDEDEAKAGPDYAEIGIELFTRETIGFLSYGLWDETLIYEFGKADEMSAAENWEADGLEHQTWYYRKKGIELDMVRTEAGRQIVNSISIIEPCTYRTKRNIGLGSTREAVLAAYRDEIDPAENRDENILVAGSVYGGIVFRFEQDQVVSIFIGAAAE